jgi:hypothetical protein
LKEKDIAKTRATHTGLDDSQKLGANLLDPESVKKVIGKQKVKNGTKIQYVAAYAAFATVLKINGNRQNTPKKRFYRSFQTKKN